MRVYLPSTLPAVARLVRTGQIDAPVRGHAVTAALREWYASGDIDELEYVAMMHAAKASLRLLQADRATPRRRVVLAVELPDEQVVTDPGFEEPGLVKVTGPVLVRDVVSGHIDDADAAAEIAEAIAALPGADAGDADARFIVDGADGHELLWYATQELGDVAG
jgi:hypothetical protein